MIKEQSLNDEPIGTEIWPCSRVLLSWMTSSPDAPSLKGLTLLELGAGCGALAMGLVAYAGVGKVYATEIPDVIEHLRENVALNKQESTVGACLWDWEETQACPAEVDIDAVDMVVAADVVYVGTAECQLSHALAGVLQPTSEGARARQAWLLLADRPRGGERFLPKQPLDEGVDPDLDEDGQPDRLTAVGRFLAACKRRGLSVEEREIDPELIDLATQEAGCVGGRREFEGRLRLFCARFA